MRKIGIALSSLALAAFVGFTVTGALPFQYRTLIYPLAFVPALVSYHRSPKSPVIWATVVLNVLATGSGLLVATDMLRFRVHDVESFVPALFVIVLFALPGVFNVLNLFKTVRQRKRNDKITPASAPSSWYDQHLEAVRSFWSRNQVEVAQRKSFILAELHKSIANGDGNRTYLLVDVALSSTDGGLVDLLNEMLLIKEHRRHQEIVKELQSRASPSSVPYLQRAFIEHLDYMAEYNGSGTGVVAKWFSHALFSIGTPEALDLLRTWSTHSASEVRNEMLYRLSKLRA